MNRNTFVCQLPDEKRKAVLKAITRRLIIDGYDLAHVRAYAQDAMDGRLVWLEDDIDLDRLGL